MAIEDVQDLLEQLIIVKHTTPEDFGAVGDGVTDDSQAWNAFIEALHSDEDENLLGVLRQKYLIPGANTKALTRHVHIVGDKRSVVDGGAASPVLFEPISAGFTFHGINVKKIGLCFGQNTTTADIPLIDVQDVKFECDLQQPFVLRIRYDINPHVVKKLRMKNVEIIGGLCGIHVLCPIEYGYFDEIRVDGIVVPNDDEYFNGDNMINVGFGSGISLGDDGTVEAELLTDHIHFGSVFIENIQDNRLQKNSGNIGTVDGVRIQAQNITLDNAFIKNVNSIGRADNTGYYMKARNHRAGKVTVIDSGGHEGMVVFKGARREDGSRADGWNASIDEIQCINTDTSIRRSPIYLSPDDINIGRLYMEGVGGDVEDPNNLGEKLPGSGPLIFSENSARTELRIGSIVALNCTVGTLSGAAKVIGLRGWKHIQLDSIHVDGLSNNTAFSNNEFQNIQVVGVFGDKEIEDVNIGHISVINCSISGGKTVTALDIEGEGAEIGHVHCGNIFTDETVDFGVITRGDFPIDVLSIAGGDLSRVKDTAINTNAQRPTTLNVRNVVGSSIKTPGTFLYANKGNTQIIPTGVSNTAAIPTVVQFIAEADSGDTSFSNTTHKFTVSEDGTYGISYQVEWVPEILKYTAVTTMKREVALVRDAGFTEWENKKLYRKGDLLQDAETGELFTANTKHTSLSAGIVWQANGSFTSGSGTMKDDRSANSAQWSFVQLAPASWDSSVYTAWANATDFDVEDIRRDEVTHEVYKCSVAHTSAPSGTFEADRTANPTFWDLFGFRNWQTTTSYSDGDKVTDGVALLFADEREARPDIWTLTTYPAWANNTVYAIGDRITSNVADFIYEVSTAHTSFANNSSSTFESSRRIPDWEASAVYREGQYAVDPSNTKTYISNFDHTSAGANFAAARSANTLLWDFFSNANNFWTLIGNPDYANTVTYAINDTTRDPLTGYIYRTTTEHDSANTSLVFLPGGVAANTDLWTNISLQTIIQIRTTVPNTAISGSQHEHASPSRFTDLGKNDVIWLEAEQSSGSNSDLIRAGGGVRNFLSVSKV